MIIYNSHEENKIEESVVALGSFDGLHVAHMQIMNKTKEFAKENNLQSGVLLFDRLPAENYFKSSKRIMSLGDKKELLSDMDFLYIQEFSKEFMKLSAMEFAELLVKKLNVKAVCAGFNYKFGKNASGNISQLKKFGRELGFEVIEFPEFRVDNETVSSTRIRELIENGDMKNAARLLGREFFMTGVVISGFGMGKTFGFPTVNLKYEKNSVLPKFGVYACLIQIENKKYTAAVNVGKRPTFEREDVTVEGFISDFEGNLYNRRIKIIFKDYLRPEIRFSGIEELTEQIEKDVITVKKMLKGEI